MYLNMPNSYSTKTSGFYTIPRGLLFPGAEEKRSKGGKEKKRRKARGSTMAFEEE
jgi:hypothetical protein